MHLKSMYFWMAIYCGLAVFDIGITYISITQRFGVEFESNLFVRALMEQYGILSGLIFYILQEFFFFFILWGLFYYFIKLLAKGKSEKTLYKIDILIFNMGVPFPIIVSALLHLAGGLSWIFLSTLPYMNFGDCLKIMLLIMMMSCIFQTYHVYKLNSKVENTANKI